MAFTHVADSTASRTVTTADDEAFITFSHATPVLDLENVATQTWVAGNVISGTTITGQLTINPDTDVNINSATTNITVEVDEMFTLVHGAVADEWTCSVYPSGSVGALALLDTVSSTEIDDEAVTLPKLAHMATDSFLGRDTAATGDVEVLSAATARGVLNVADNADVTDSTSVNAAGAVMETDYNANTVLAATTDNTPVTLTVGEQTLVGRITAGNIAALTPAQIRTLINVEDDADVNPTTEEIQDIVGPFIATGGTKTGITVTYQDTTDDMDFELVDAYVEDLAGGLFTGNTETGITATYQVADNTVDLVVAEMGSLPVPTTDVDFNDVSLLQIGAAEFDIDVSSGSGDYTPDVSNNSVFHLTATAARTILAPTGEPISGEHAQIFFYLEQDGTGSRVWTLNGAFIPAGGSAPTFSTAAGDIDLVTAVTKDGGTEWFYWLIGSFAS